MNEINEILRTASPAVIKGAHPKIARWLKLLESKVPYNTVKYAPKTPSVLSSILNRAA